MLLTSFDKSSLVKFNPEERITKIKDMPATVVVFFEFNLFAAFIANYNPVKIATLQSSTRCHNVYKVVVNKKPIAVFQSGVGAPYTACLIEEAIAMGAKNILMFGSCGALVETDKDVIVPTAAIRDEGTSFHYMEPGNEIELNKKYVKKVISYLDKNKIEYLVGKTWTTDAIYRETEAKIETCVNDGCVAVEMECAAVAAICKFRKVNFSQFLYVGDDLSGEDWNAGDLHMHVTDEKLRHLNLALNLASKIF